MVNDIDLEIEKLKIKKIELVNRMNLTQDFEEKEDLDEQMRSIQNQIDTLEKFKGK